MGGLSIFRLSRGNRFKREGRCASSWVNSRQSGAATGDLPIYRLTDAFATPACDGKSQGLPETDCHDFPRLPFIGVTSHRFFDAFAVSVKPKRAGTTPGWPRRLSRKSLDLRSKFPPSSRFS